VGGGIKAQIIILRRLSQHKIVFDKTGIMSVAI